MKTIVLMRHAKSSWSDPGIEDFDRPLNKRGRMTAALMGAYLAEHDIAPDVVIHSGAERTKETWQRIKIHIRSKGTKVAAEKKLYMADPDTMLQIVKATPDEAATLLIIGHQPGLSAFARKLANGSVPTTCSRSFKDFPTAATAILQADVEHWQDINLGKAEYVSFGTPKDLV